MIFFYVEIYIASQRWPSAHQRAVCKGHIALNRVHIEQNVDSVVLLIRINLSKKKVMVLQNADLVQLTLDESYDY